MKFSDIKPIGTFDEILESIRLKVDASIAHCHTKKKYTSRLAKWIKFIVTEMALLEVFEESARNKDASNLEENMQCLLYTHLLIIDINDCAQQYLNSNITMDSRQTQLQDYIDQHPEIFEGLKLI